MLRTVDRVIKIGKRSGRERRITRDKRRNMCKGLDEGK